LGTKSNGRGADITSARANRFLIAPYQVVKRDTERIERLRTTLRNRGMDALICMLPNHVLLCSGYWPVIGASFAIVTREGQVALLVPEDELQLAREGWADEVDTFRPASLTDLRPVQETAKQPLAHILAKLGLTARSVVGFEEAPASVPVPYAAVLMFGSAGPKLVQEAAPGAQLSPAADALIELEAVLTTGEVERIRTACQAAGDAFSQAVHAVQAGVTEPEDTQAQARWSG
jgi:Xaa-Pro aminopeptidase